MTTPVVLSIIAIIISCASLLVSLNTFRFNKRIKSLELREKLTAKMVEITSRFVAVDACMYEINRKKKDLKERLDGIQFELPEEHKDIFDSSDMKSTKKELDKCLSSLASIPAAHSETAYTENFHSISLQSVLLEEMDACNKRVLFELNKLEELIEKHER